jgi:hypothetical protein
MSFLKRLSQKNELVPAYMVSETLPQVPIWEFYLGHDIDPSEIAKNVHDFSRQYPAADTGKITGRRSDFITHRKTNLFDELLQIIAGKITDIMIASKYLTEAEYNEPVVTESWGIVYKNGQGTTIHHHGLSAFSTVFYARADVGCSPLAFEDGTKVYPKTGSLLIFPGYASHYVPESQSDEDRIVFVANFSLAPKKGLKYNL